MGEAESEGVNSKLPGNDAMETVSVPEGEEAPLMITPGNSPPTSPVTVKHLQVEVSIPLEDPENVGDCESQVEQSPTALSIPEEGSQAQNQSTDFANVPKSPRPSTSPSSPPPSPMKGVQVIPSSPLGGNEKAKEWSPTQLGVDNKTELPAGWKPGPNSVICGRGKECFEAEGVSHTGI